MGAQPVNVLPFPARPDPRVPQLRAAAARSSVWVSASAGTGKTKVLTDRVINLLLADTPPSRILCLTFTKAAAAEMANRLAARLSNWTTLPEAALHAELQALTGAFPETAMIEQARRLFARVLDAPGGLKILTIHSFCQTVLARFPLEAEIAPHFTVAEERDAAEMLDRARNELVLLARSGHAPALGAALDEVTRHVPQREFGALLAALMSERGRFRRLLDKHRGLDGLSAHLHAWLDLPVGTDETALLTEGCRDAVIAEEALRRVCKALAGGTRPERERSAGICRWLDNPESRVSSFDHYREMFFNNDGRITKNLANKKTINACPDAHSVLLQEAERLAALRERCNAATVLAATAALLRLAEALLEGYERQKRMRNLLDYDDLILKTRDLLRDRSGWVLYKLDGGIDHILIDEAQDTNPEQWQVVAALAERVLRRRRRARGHAHRVRGRRRQAVDLQLPAGRSGQVRGDARTFPRPLRGGGTRLGRCQPGYLVPLDACRFARRRRGVRRRREGRRRAPDAVAAPSSAPCRAGGPGRGLAAGARRTGRRRLGLAGATRLWRIAIARSQAGRGDRRDHRRLAQKRRAARGARSADPRRRHHDPGAPSRR